MKTGDRVTTPLGYEAQVIGFRGEYVYVRYDQDSGSHVRVNILKVEQLVVLDGGETE